MANGISRETFDGMDVESKLGVLFDYAHENYQNIRDLKQRPFKDKCYAFAGGVLGGILAAVGIKWGS
ncbi:MAG: hypothetical protein ABFD76_08265 [Smithella sp.]